MVLGTKDVVIESRDFISKYASYGINKLKVNNIEVHPSGESSYRIVFKMETAPIDDPNFTPIEEGIRGQICNPSLFLNMSEDKSRTMINKFIGAVADALGLKEAADKVSGDDVQSYFKAIADVLCCGKFAWFVLSAKEYQAGKYNLNFPLYDFVAAVDKMDEDTIVMEAGRIISINYKSGRLFRFDKSSKYHFKAFVEPKQTDDTQLNGSGLGTFTEAPKKSISIDDDLPFAPSTGSASFL